jgi:hypothetical protein
MSDAVRLQIGSPNFTAVRGHAVRQINLVQTERPSDQIFGTAVALIALAEAVGLDAFDVIVSAKRAMNNLEGPFTHQVQAIRDYAKSELRNA